MREKWEGRRGWVGARYRGGALAEEYVAAALPEAVNFFSFLVSLDLRRTTLKWTLHQASRLIKSGKAKTFLFFYFFCLSCA